MKAASGYLAFVLLLCAHYTWAQKENNVWAFGPGLGIDFNDPSGPVLIRTAIASLEGPASVCDPSGRLLFYSNGRSVWDSTHQLMPDGTGLLGGMLTSSTQGCGIVPVPAAPGKYYLFTIGESISTDAGTGDFSYSLVDMALNEGKGNIVTAVKNKHIASGMSEKMLFAPACAGTWVITHQRDSPVFYAQKITAAGLSEPVRSVTPGVTRSMFYVLGEMRLSPDGRTIAMGAGIFGRTVSDVPYALLYDFNAETGEVRHKLRVDNSSDIYSVEFSGDGSKVYFISDGYGIEQYDLSLLPDSAAFARSKYVIGGKWISVRRGPDQKLYLRPYDPKQNIARINDPGQAGAACDLQLDVPSLRDEGHTGLTYYYNFGNDVGQAGPSKSTRTNRQEVQVCPGGQVLLSVDLRNKDFLWNDGSTERTHSFSKPGKYWCTSRYICQLVTDTFYVTQKKADTISRPGKDTTVCFNTSYTLKAPKGSSYLWSDGTTGATNTLTLGAKGKKWVYTDLNDAGCKVVVDTFSVSFIQFDLNIPDTSICLDQELVLDATTPNARAYLWDNVPGGPVMTLGNPGIHTVSVFVGPCVKTDTIRIRSKALGLNLGPDTVVCSGKTFRLEPKITEADYLWQDGSTHDGFEVSSGGLYSVVANRNGCTETASVQVDYKTCMDCVRIPNAFTPNGDGRNDLFRPLVSCPAAQSSFIVMNRYGQQVFNGGNMASSGWDGTFNGQELETGTYYYLFRVTFDYPGAQEEQYKGDIALLR